MSRTSQSKAQNEANARTLRAMVKQPENKVCCDCKRNDPRWASWNIGCFLCIRCSGIHRSMGTHISRVKSIDLDIWTPEQMASIQRWGNKRCNAYWEAHLKPGHIPPEHKIESFIRSKYETARWARNGPPPEDPSVLDETPSQAAPPTAAAAAPASTARGAPALPRAAPSAIDLLGGDISPSAATTSVTSAQASRQQASLLDNATAGPSGPAAAQSQVSKPSTTASSGAGSGGGLFDLDWHDGPTAPPSNGSAAAVAPAGASAAPSTSGARGGPKGKNDILSLFASAKPAPAFDVLAGQAGADPRATSAAAGSSNSLSGLDAFGGLSLGGGATATTTRSPPRGVAPASAAFGGATAGANPWASTAVGGLANNTTAAVGTTSDVWGSSGPSGMKPSGSGGGLTGLGSGADIWGSSTPAAASQAPAAASAQQKSALDDLWGEFK